MSKARLDGLQLLLLGSVFFLLIGVLMERSSPLGLADFKQIYYGAQCLMQHRDPYNQAELMAHYQAETGEMPADPSAASQIRMIVSLFTNLPTTLLLVAPLAALPWTLAATVWTALATSSFIFAASLVWSIGASAGPRFAGCMIFLLIVNSGLLLSTGNPAALVISLSIIAAVCFIRERFVTAGMVCLAVSLAIKPHDAGLIWLYFLLAGGVQRRRALRTLAFTAALALAACLWVARVAPRWPQELQANLSTAMSHGGRDDPGPATGGGRGVGMTINLQTIVSRVRDDPGFYNPIVYCIIGALLLAWAVKTLQVGFSTRAAWFALAAAGSLAMLPVYHRTYDAKLLLLTIPACAQLWAERNELGWCAFALNTAAMLLTGDLLWIVAFHLTRYSGPALVLAMFPAPLILLVLGAFYVWVYVREPALS